MTAFEGVGAAGFRLFAAFLAFFCGGDGGLKDFDCVGGCKDRVQVCGHLLHRCGFLSVNGDDEASEFESGRGWAGICERWRYLGEDADLV